MLSLQTRLGLGLLLSLLSLFAVFWLVVSPAIRTLAEDHIASRLRHDGETLLSMLQVDTQGNISIDAGRITLVYSRPFSGHYFKIDSNGHHLHSRSLWDHELKLPEGSGRPEAVYHLDGPQGQPLLLSVQQYRKDGQPVTIAVAEDLSTLEAKIRQFLNLFALTAGLLLVALIVIQILIIRGGLRPLQRIRRELRQLEYGELPRLTEQAPAEIQPMIHEINHLLDVMGQRLQRSRHALGDLAHALKKPLTVLTQLCDDEAVRSQPRLRYSLDRQITAMRNTTEHILKRARLAGEGPVGPAYDARAEIMSLIETLKKMHHDKKRMVEMDLPPDLRIHIDREDLLELLGNLLDNAFKWSRQHIRLRIHRDDQGIHIEIEDDGPGIAPDQLQPLSQRGSRLDEYVEGHGLGLAISQDIVTLYGGDLLFARAEELGGLRVTIRIASP